MITPVAKIRPIRPEPEVLYSRPTLDEMVQLCKDFGLIKEIKSLNGRFHISCKDDVFDVTPSETETLVRGLLIGYFAFQTRDDLALADWLE